MLCKGKGLEQAQADFCFLVPLASGRKCIPPHRHSRDLMSLES